MLSIPSSTAIYLHTSPTDMRRGFDGLCGMIRSEFEADPLDGSLFLFINRRRDRMKILHWDGTGFWLFYKRLEAGTFQEIVSDEKRVQIDATQLAMLLAGVCLNTAQRRKRYRQAS